MSSPRTLSALFGPKGPLASQFPGFLPRPQQKALADAVEQGLKEGRPVLAEAGTGVGKCLAAGTPILLFNGSIKKVEDVIVGDELMGPDSLPRKVLSLSRGKEMLYRITPTKGDAYTVNESHILSLKITKGAPVRKAYKPGEIVNISITDYLNQSKKFKHLAKGYRVPVNFPKQEIPIDAYFIGIWLGDGNSKNAGVTTMDNEIVDYLQNLAKSNNVRLRKTIDPLRCPTYFLTTGGTERVANRWHSNPIEQILKDLNLLNNKHIPDIYKLNCRETRLNILAGLIDSDGTISNNCYDIIFKSETLATDTVFLARSLGFAANIKACNKTCTNNGKTGLYFRITISGNINEVPTKIHRKTGLHRKQIKDHLLTGINVEKTGEGEYFGFTIDGDRLFLLGDFTVTHNTLAYLVPLLRWLDKNGGRAVVSTHTLALQSQLVERDVPNLLKALPELDIRPIALKGRQNYLCLQDLDVAASDLLNSGDPQFKMVQRWASETDSGDVAELDFTWPGWSEVAANADSCRGRECRHYDRCFYYKARKHADDCNLFLVNHALFFADLRLKRANPNGPSLIPNYDAVIFDEAHHVEDIATRAFGLEWGSGRLPYLLHRARKVDGVEEHTLQAIDALHSRLLTPFVESRSQEAFLEELAASDDAKKSFIELRNQLCGAIDSLATALTRAADRASAPTDRDRASGLARTANRLSSELGAMEPTRTDEHFHWYNVRQTRSGNVVATLTRTPYEIAAPLAESLLAKTPRVGFVSATLAAGEGADFAYLKSRLGLDEEDAPSPIETVQGSPFDFAKRSLLYVPRHLGPPSSSAEYVEAALEEMENLIALSGGRAFALFTSHRMLQSAATRWRGNIPYPLFVQGEQPGQRLIEAFVASGNGVLLGASSFWEGVDVPGDALSLVILDKLPFATPDSPPQRAREERLIAGGGNAFMELSVPQATLRLKQGFGRLLRTQTDRGVVAILDERLWTKRYGTRLLAALPPSPRTDEIELVREFFSPGTLDSRQ